MQTLAEIARSNPGGITLAGIALTAISAVTFVMGVTLLVASMWFSWK